MVRKPTDCQLSVVANRRLSTDVNGISEKSTDEIHMVSGTLTNATESYASYS